MRNRYFVCYDIKDPQRLIQVHKKMKGYGEPVQYSVFMCDLNSKEVIIMREDLENMLNTKEDKTLIINLGTVKKSKDRIYAIGAQLDVERETSIVI